MCANKSSNLDHRPVYIQIAKTLRSRILSGEYDDRLDGELKLAKQWHVSRRTIQQSLEFLAKEGLITRKHGRGTFINKRRVDGRYKSIISITKGVENQGLKPEFDILASQIAEPMPEEIEFFNLGQDDRIYRHERLISSQGRPLAYSVSGLDLAKLPDLDLSQLDGSLYSWLRRKYKRTIVDAQDQYIPVMPSAKISRLLNLAENTPIFSIIRRAKDQTGAPIEYSVTSTPPVALDISITHSSLQAGRDDAEEWFYTIGLGQFTPS